MPPIEARRATTDTFIIRGVPQVRCGGVSGLSARFACMYLCNCGHNNAHAQCASACVACVAHPPIDNTVVSTLATRALLCIRVSPVYTWDYFLCVKQHMLMNVCVCVPRTSEKLACFVQRNALFCNLFVGKY